MIKRYLFAVVVFFDCCALYDGNRASSYPYISGDTFRAACDFVFDDDASFDPANVREPSLIFVQPEYLQRFFDSKHPFIKAPYVLVTHNSDEAVPGRFVTYLEDSKIIHWFGQNPSVTHHQKFTPLPIGLANRYWPHGKPELIDQALKLDHLPKRIFVYLNFSVFNGIPWDEDSVLYKRERNAAFGLFAHQPWVTVALRKGQDEYLDDLTKACFVLSPRGHGLDCHRTWEALLLGAIPVVKTSTLDPLYENLPVVIVNDWQEVTHDVLMQLYLPMKAKTYAMQKLYVPFWIAQMKNELVRYQQLLHFQDANSLQDTVGVLVGDHQKIEAARIVNVDFDTALGKNQLKLIENVPADLFKDCLFVRPAVFSKEWDCAALPQTAYDLYAFFKNLYDKNAPWLLKSTNTYRIPRKIHQIWIQGEMPAAYKAWQQSWQHIPGWEYLLWTDKEIRALGLKNQKLYDEAAGDYPRQSDIARVEILCRFGGVYVDSDIECLNPAMFDLFNQLYTFYVGIQPLNTTILALANGLMGSAVGHPVLEAFINKLAHDYDPSLPTHMSTGPIAFTRVFLEFADRPGYVDVALPPTYFFPSTICAVWTRPTSGSCKAFPRPESMAVHYWHGR